MTTTLAKKLRPDRAPPMDVEAEESVLGSMMLSAAAIPEVAEIVRPEDFARTSHRYIFEALTALYGRGEPVDQITARAELQARGLLEEIGGPLRVHEIVEQTPTPASAVHYARIVAETAHLRRILEATGTIQDRIYGGQDPENAAEVAESLIYAAAHSERRGEVATMAELVEGALSELDAPEREVVATGFPDLDSKLGGLQRGALIIVAARPGVGKTSFVVTLARKIALSADLPVALFSFEMSRQEIAMRVLCAEAQVPWTRIRERMLTEANREHLARAGDVLHAAPISVADSPTATIVDIRGKARRMASRDGLGLVIVDYLQLMIGERRSETREREVAEISRGLKVLARELRVPVLVCSQLNRDPERRQDKRPQLSDLRESGAQEQDADVVLFLHREGTDDARQNVTNVIIAKHRNGPTGTAKLTFLPDLMSFASHASERGGEK